MTKEKENENDEAVAEIEETSTEVATNDAFQTMDIDSMVNQLDAYEEGIEVTGEYYKFAEGEEVRCFYIGKSKITSKFDNGVDGKVTAVRLLFPDKTFKICASTMLVGVLSEMTAPAPVKIIQTGREEGPNGEYDVFRVFPLG